MIAWDQELIMMPLDFGVLQWHIVLMEPGDFRTSMLVNSFSEASYWLIDFNLMLIIF